MYEHFSKRALADMHYAHALAVRSEQLELNADNILCGLVRDEQGLIVDVFEHFKLNPVKMYMFSRARLRFALKNSKARPVLSEEAKRILVAAYSEAALLRDREVKPTHLLLAILNEGTSPTAKSLIKHRLTLALVREYVASLPRE